MSKDQEAKQQAKAPKSKHNVVPKAGESPRDFGAVHRYWNLAQQSPEYVPALGRAFVEVKEGLSPAQVRSLCKELGFQKGSGVYHNLISIGENADRFQPYLKRLPSDLFVLYQLALMEQTEFRSIIQNDLFSPTTTAWEFDNMSKFPKKGLFIDLSRLETAERTEACREIESLRSKFRFGLRPSDQPNGAVANR